jgi:hypothetical protein
MAHEPTRTTNQFAGAGVTIARAKRNCLSGLVSEVPRHPARW